MAVLHRFIVVTERVGLGTRLVLLRAGRPRARAAGRQVLVPSAVIAHAQYLPVVVLFYMYMYCRDGVY